MARSLHVRLDDVSATALEIVRAGHLSDSEAVGLRSGSRNPGYASAEHGRRKHGISARGGAGRCANQLLVAMPRLTVA